MMTPMLLASCSPKTYNYTSEELSLKSGENAVYGILYRPEGVKNAPLVIFSHGYGSSHEAGKKYAEILAPKGYAVYMYQVYAASENPGVENRVQGRQRNGIVDGRERKAVTLLHLIGQIFAYKARIRAKDNHITIIYQTAGIVVHHFDDTIHHWIPGVNK